jgi:hypothetical protein
MIHAVSRALLIAYFILVSLFLHPGIERKKYLLNDG